VEVGSGKALSGQLGILGGGVGITGYNRVRDAMLDHARWESRSTLAYANEQGRVMHAVESLFPRGSGSLEESLDGFWNGWSDLADHPTDAGVRFALRGRADALVAKFHSLDQGLDRLKQEASLTLGERVTEANQLLDQVGSLNVQIAHSVYAKNPDLGAMDQRDLSLQRLAELLPARFEEQSDGSTSVYLRGLQVVQVGHVTNLNLDKSGPDPQLTIGDAALAFPTGLDSGEIGALLGPVIDGIGTTRSNLNSLVSTLVAQVNAVHSAGYGADGSTGNDFFDAAGTTASSVDLSSDIDDPQAIAGSSSATAAGDNANALALHDIRYANVMSGGSQTMADNVVDIVSEVGASVVAARARALGAESTVAGLDALAEGVSKVSIDDEMVTLIKLQQAYAASARVLSTSEEMFDLLLSI
ncbi:MAG: flagellar hook-associated protein 1 FlgK, partial [Rhodothermales bacterium]